MIRALTLMVALFVTLPVNAQTIDELKAELTTREAELAAQVQINALQRQRIETLEAKLSGKRLAVAPPSKQNPEREAGDPEEDGALERALLRRGIAVLPPYSSEVTPSLAWSHSGSDFNSSTQDTFTSRLDARMGLPGGWMIGASLPYTYRDIAGLGDNSGVGDISATAWKSLFSQTDTRPSLVGSLRYSAPTGDDFSDDPVALGSGFHSLTSRLSSSKRFDPIAVYGDVSYTHLFDETINGIDLNRSGIAGFGFGANLAVTPDITMNTGLSFFFEDEIEVNGIKIRGSDTTVGQFEFGFGIVLAKDVFLNFNGAVGITDDSPDVSLGISLPIRF